MGKIDWTKPIRQHNGLGARFIAKDSQGNPLIEAQFPDGNWSRACTWYPHEVDNCFENVPAERPKLTGFIALHGNNRDRALGCNDAVFCENDAEDLRETTDSAYHYVTIIDLSKVNPEAIEWLDP